MVPLLSIQPQKLPIPHPLHHCRLGAHHLTFFFFPLVHRLTFSPFPVPPSSLSLSLSPLSLSRLAIYFVFAPSIPPPPPPSLKTKHKRRRHPRKTPHQQRRESRWILRCQSSSKGTAGTSPRCSRGTRSSRYSPWGGATARRPSGRGRLFTPRRRALNSSVSPFTTE